MKTKQGKAMEVYAAHIHGVAGSSPAPAIKDLLKNLITPPRRSSAGEFLTKTRGRGEMNKGSIYRLGVKIKEFGERMGHTKVFRLPLLSLLCSLVIRFGLAVRDSVRNCPVSGW